MSALSGCDDSASGASRKLVWSDEFKGPAGKAPSASRWRFEVFGDGSGNQELQCYTSAPGNVATNGRGKLVITARKQPGHRCADGHTNDYTSGRITTQGMFSTRYGTLEVRAKVPAGVGTWPAFWALGTNKPRVGWPAAGEIDVMEHVGRRPRQVSGSVHGPDAAGQRWYLTRKARAERDLSRGYHVYSVDWSPQRLVWRLDGKAYGTVTKAQVKKAGGRWVFDHRFYLLLNLAVGGNLGGEVPASTTWPQKYSVDYVRVYRNR
ncbi:glycoside hydrolase family 16 protein [Aeromicrobium wangtongii]|uniref:glycoside hydrolase family 16 protein n=1 Tax=Aeromicrobium wangtongii TaxID=2969247 RepID=UPI002017AF52|nr:glycoside hydrolase family 16 protein [Aeromicrobium wangtongii]MCL3817440.1 glycoside hydrolase family 16 protein [Aeromicrobium wangtongii]